MAMATERVRWWDPAPNVYAATNPLDVTPNSTRIKSGLRGLQRTLIRADCECSITGRYDEETRRAVAFFQGSRSYGRLRETGVFNKPTAVELFSRIASFYEHGFALPGPFIRGFFHFEGVWDMCSLGPNLKDCGLAMINLAAHTNVTMLQACDPWFSGDFAAWRLVEAMNLFDDWDAAIVYHRSPLWADAMAGVVTWQRVWDRTMEPLLPEQREWATADEIETEARRYVANIRSGGL